VALRLIKPSLRSALRNPTPLIPPIWAESRSVIVQTLQPKRAPASVKVRDAGEFEDFLLRASAVRIRGNDGPNPG